MIVACNNNISDIYYSGYTIEKVYACGGSLVYEKEPQPLTNKVRGYSSSLDLSSYKYCDSTSAVTSAETSTWIAENSSVDIKDSLTNLWFYDCVVEIGASAFSGFTSIQKINNMGNNLKHVRDNAFDGCSGINNPIFFGSVETIGRYAFRGCVNLPSLNFCTVDCNLESIGSYAFYGCISLTSVSIPSTIKQIGIGAFNNCTSLKDIYLYATTPPTISNNASMFSGLASDFLIHIPKSAYEAYKANSAWYRYLTHITGDINQ